MKDEIWNGKERRVEEEDRRQLCFLHSKTLDRIEAHLETQEKTSQQQENFISQAKIVGYIAITLYAASFLYPYILNERVESDIELHRNLIDSNSKRISDVRGDQQILIFKIEILTNELQKVAEQNTRLIGSILNTRPRGQIRGENINGDQVQDLGNTYK